MTLLRWSGLAALVLLVAIIGRAAIYPQTGGSHRVSAEPSQQSPTDSDPALERGAGWPQWGGPDRQFGSAGLWTAGEPRILWQRPVGGGHAQLVVDGGRVFAHHRLHLVPYTEALEALSADTGERLWLSKVEPTELSTLNIAPRTAGPNSTPALSGDHIVVVGRSVLVRCIDATTGAVRWQRDLVRDLGARVPEYGYASSPLIMQRSERLEDIVVLPVAGPTSGLAALSLADGSTLWLSEGIEPSYSSPLLAQVGVSQSVVFVGGDRTVGVDPQTGTTQWTIRPRRASTANITSPLASRQRETSSRGTAIQLAFSGPSFKGSALFNLGHRRDTLTVTQLWSSPREVKHGNWVRTDDLILGHTGVTLTALSTLTGERHWSRRYPTSNLTLLADGTVAILTERGRLHHASVSPQGFELLADIKLFDTPSWTAPSLLGDRLFARNEEEIKVLDLSTE